MFTFPINETYIAFGDGSSNDAGSFYGLVLIPELNISQIEKELGKLKNNFGGESECSIHCRELFNVHARKKSMWSHLSYENVVTLCGETLGMIRSYQPKYLLAYVPKVHYPKRFRLKDKNGHADLVHDINEKWLEMWAFFRIGGFLDPVAPILPDDPKIKPRPLNRPHWNMVIKRTDPGLRVKKVYLDREKTMWAGSQSPCNGYQSQENWLLKTRMAKPICRLNILRTKNTYYSILLIFLPTLLPANLRTINLLTMTGFVVRFM